MSNNVFILMGVCGTGKSSLGKIIAKQFNGRFFEGDDFHTKFNKNKMLQGIPLNDDDRKGWLEDIGKTIKKERKKSSQPIFFVCSALKEIYRNSLKQVSREDINWLWLHGDTKIIRERLINRQKREAHYMKPEMLQSQLDILEPPTQNYLYLDINLSFSELTKIIYNKFKTRLLKK